MSRDKKQLEKRQAATPAELLTNEHGEGFVRIEKNLITLGFFTPTSSALKETRVKTVRFTRDDDEQKLETAVRIVTGGDYGLPGTADLDKWLAFQKFLNNILNREGQVKNPISFTSWELLSLLGVHRRSGKNYEGVSEWLDRMCATTMEFIGEGKVSGQKRSRKDRGEKVFEKSVSFGRELKPGVTADRNYVWLSPWQLDNINNHFLIPIDFDTYLKLKSPIAKTLVPLLQVWLYATRTGGVFTKGYGELCEILGIKEWKQESRIREKLGPSLEELQQCGYLASWGIEKRKVGEGFKVVLRHGEKFYRDLHLQQSKHAQLRPAPIEKGDEQLVELLTVRGISLNMAEQLVRERAPGTHIDDYTDWFDHLMESRKAKKFTNPPGLLITLIRTRSPIPSNFETSRMRQLREESQRRERDDFVDQYILESEYHFYVEEEISHYLKSQPPERLRELRQEATKRFKKDFPRYAEIFSEEDSQSVIIRIAEKIVEPEVTVMSFQEFVEKRRQESAAAS